jgi:hypothetical protein
MTEVEWLACESPDKRVSPRVKLPHEEGRPMTESEWLACTDPSAILSFLVDSDNANERKFRLFACACVRRLWHRFSDGERRAVEVSERYADGLANGLELDAAGGDNALLRQGREADPDWNWRAVLAAIRIAADVLNCKGSGDERGVRVREQTTQAGLLRDCFGTVAFRPLPAIQSVWLAWNDGFIPRFAEAAYEERCLPEGTLDPTRLAVLADALEDAGCTDAAILDHLRGPGPHVRGCWALDLVLGKE